VTFAFRLLVTATASLALCGCNQVISTEPWFGAEDAVGAPKLRDGLWVLVRADCRFDRAKPSESWPDCALPWVVRGDEWLAAEWDEQDEGRKARRTFSGWTSTPVVIANGEPLILQYPIANGPSANSDEAGATGSKSYWYFAMRPAEFDVDGKAVGFALWDVACGPLPAHPKGKRSHVGDDWAEETATVTDRPFPGLVITDKNCTAESTEALRGAAVLSETLDEEGPANAHWVRDGWH